MSDKKDFCNDIAVIPQYGGTCWFNAMLMAIFYSQRMRKVAIKISKTWDKKDKLFNLYKLIIKQSYSKKKENLQLFYKYKPEIIILKIIKDYETHLKKTFININKKQEYGVKWSGYLSNINYLLIHLKIPFLAINYINSADDLVFNINKYYQYITSPFYDIDISNFNKLIFDNDKKEIQKILDNSPDVLIINEEMNIQNIYNNHLQNPQFRKAFLFKNYKTKTTDINSIKELKDEIIFNGCVYKLDSCLLGSSIKTTHAIAGITCNNKRFVYNGWNNQSVDPAYIVNKHDNNVNPCALMPFEWDLHKENFFCLNPVTCKLDFIKNPKDLCFSFHKTGRRTLIYVKVNDTEESLSQSSKTSNDIEFSDKKELVYNAFKVELLDTYNLLLLLNEYIITKFTLFVKYYSLLQNTIRNIVESFNIDLNYHILRDRLLMYSKNTIDSKTSPSLLFTLYNKEFTRLNFSDIDNKKFNDPEYIINEIKKLYPDYNLPYYISSIEELNELLFNLYKIKGDTFFLISENIINSHYPANILFIFKYLILIAKYFSFKIKNKHVKVFRHVLKLILNDIYQLGEDEHDKIIQQLEQKIIECESKLKPTKITSPAKLKQPSLDSITHKSLTKLELIEKIKKINPLLKGLQPKSKAELLKILEIIKLPVKKDKEKIEIKLLKPELIEKIKKIDNSIKGLQQKKKEELMNIYKNLIRKK